jgi:hypothetical protein
MIRVRVLLVIAAIASLSAPAMAQTGRCSAGIQDPPIFSLVMSSPVRLSFKNTTEAPFSGPFVTSEGSELTVSQKAPDYQLASRFCNNQSVSLGDLAPGPYTVKWEYEEDLGSAVFATFTFAFTIPEATPCVPGMSIEPRSPAAGQPVSILYAATFRGFLQTPDVAIDGNQITIDQPAVIADPAFPGHIPCALGIVQFGALQPGYYAVVVRSNSGAPMSDAFIVRPLTRVRAVRGH